MEQQKEHSTKDLLRFQCELLAEVRDKQEAILSVCSSIQTWATVVGILVSIAAAVTFIGFMVTR